MTLEQELERSKKWQQVLSLAYSLFPGEILESTSMLLCPCKCNKRISEVSITIRKVIN